MDLYEDYLKIGPLIGEAQENLAAARGMETEAYQRLGVIKESYDREEAAMLATDERAGGKNDTERKRNANALIHNERAKGGRLHGYWLALTTAEGQYQDATTEKEICIDRFSGIRNVARIVSGLAYSLGA